MALTKKAIDSFKYDGRSMDFRPDGPDGVPNFGVRVYKGGTKSFVLGYRKPGSRKQRWITIGKYGVFTIQQARETARGILVGLSHNVDPKVEEAVEEVTLEEFTPLYLEDARTRGLRSVRQIEGRIQKHLLPTLGRKALSEITRADVARLHFSIGKTAPVEANRVVQALKALINRAEMMGCRDEGSVNPCRGIKLYKETSRTRYLDTRELLRLKDALGEEPIHIQCLIYLLLYSGLRKSELLSLPWDAVHFDHAEGPHIDVRQTKNGRDLTLALTPEMEGIFRVLPTRLGSRWCFPSPRRTNHHLSDIKHVWNHIRDKAGLGDATIHDLRRTCGSLMAQNGVPIQHIGQVLNHSDSEVTQVYARLSENNQREALNVASEALNRVFGELKIA